MIDDDFARLTVSRQRKYQLRKKREGKCIICGEQADGSVSFCQLHRRKQNVIQREGGRRRHGRTRRYLNAESYSYEA